MKLNLIRMSQNLTVATRMCFVALTCIGNACRNAADAGILEFSGKFVTKCFLLQHEHYADNGNHLLHWPGEPKYLVHTQRAPIRINYQPAGNVLL